MLIVKINEQKAREKDERNKQTIKDERIKSAKYISLHR